MSGTEARQGTDYRWLREPVGEAWTPRQQRVCALRDAHQHDPEFGYRLLASEARDAGFPKADRTAWRIFRDARIMSAIVKTPEKRGKTAGPPVCNDLVNRDFTARGPNQL